MTPEEISERFIGAYPYAHGQFKTWDELRLSHETEIEKYAQSQNAAIQKHNADLIETSKRKDETIAYYKELSEKADEVINRPYAGVYSIMSLDQSESMAENNARIWQEYEALKSNKPK